MSILNEEQWAEHNRLEAEGQEGNYIANVMEEMISDEIQQWKDSGYTDAEVISEAIDREFFSDYQLDKMIKAVVTNAK